MFKYVVALSLIVGCAFASFTPVKQCASQLPLPVDVKVNECKQSPCQLKRGTYVNADIKFTAPYDDLEDIKVKVKATALGIVTHYPLPDPNVCDHLTDTACPLAEGEEATYHLKFPIFKSLGTIPVLLEMTLVSGQGDIACFEIDTVIV